MWVMLAARRASRRVSLLRPQSDEVLRAASLLGLRAARDSQQAAPAQPCASAQQHQRPHPVEDMRTSPLSASSLVEGTDAREEWTGRMAAMTDVPVSRVRTWSSADAAKASRVVNALGSSGPATAQPQVAASTNAAAVP